MKLKTDKQKKMEKINEISNQLTDEIDRTLGTLTKKKEIDLHYQGQE